MNSISHLNDLKYEVLYKKSHGFCDTCFSEGDIPDPDDDENIYWGTVICPDCHGEGVLYHDGFDERSTITRELWVSVWRAARMNRVGNNPCWEAFSLMTDSMLFAHMLDMTPLQLFDLIKASRKLLSDRDAAQQQNMLQYKLALRNGEVDFDEDLPF